MGGTSGKRKIERLDTLIGQQTEMRGDLLFTGGLHIDGNVKGNVVALNDGASSLVVSERGSVEGQIRAPHVTINGMVIGDVYAIESVELASQARITGNVYYRRLEVAMGAEVNGSLIHLDEAGLPPSPPGQEIAAPPHGNS
ncbi:MAG: polymer-forming cytoskeletal protein [Gammaproteobacteria bacterium]|jgi:cytoskeletal protein CcmA (bactofilin family)|nr:polymer-forming cytoskeletal protein [Gammaproteobacteria bacterium]